MSTGGRVTELLLRWEEERQRGRTLTAEELCPDEPEVREALRRRLRDRELFRAFWSQDATTRQDAGPPPQGAAPAVEGLEVLGELGRGGMGVVYRARQTKLGRPAALKVVLAEGAAAPGERARFFREAEATARLQHPNIVQIYELGELGGRPYFVLELVEGGTLADRLRGAPLPVRPAAELVLVLARAVHHAHQRGVLHRDLKPGNVLLAADGTPKVADFGLARRLDLDGGQTQTGAFVGTPSYAAPEQAEGRVRDLGPATDVYALGAILYECLTGRPPFRAASVLETLDQVRTHDPVRPAALQPGLPRDLEAVCLKCLEKDPRHRYPSAQALADDLQRFLDGEPVTARSLNLLDRLGRVLSYAKPSGPGLRSWSTSLFVSSPLPAAIQLVLFLLFAGQASYPVICLSLPLLAAVPLTALLLWPMREPLRNVPRSYRRYVWSVMFTRFAGYPLVPLVVALARPGHDLAEFFVVFPLWIYLDGNYYFVFASEAGVFYAAALFYYAVAVGVSLVPAFGPLAVGVMISVSMVLDALYLRFWGD